MEGFNIHTLRYFYQHGLIRIITYLQNGYTFESDEGTIYNYTGIVNQMETRETKMYTRLTENA